MRSDGSLRQALATLSPFDVTFHLRKVNDHISKERRNSANKVVLTPTFTFHISHDLLSRSADIGHLDLESNYHSYIIANRYHLHVSALADAVGQFLDIPSALDRLRLWFDFRRAAAQHGSLLAGRVDGRSQE